MKLPVSLSCLFALLVASVIANTEKAIFTAPAPVAFTDDNPSLDVLQLQSLTHNKSSLRTALNVVFPAEDTPQGSDHWFLLRDLNPHQRYELRVCWAAIVCNFPLNDLSLDSSGSSLTIQQQPTDFWLDTYTISEVFDTPTLIQNLAEYAENGERQRLETAQSSSPQRESVLFLRVRAAADFFTTDKQLMSNPPPVDVDIILDPYVLNIFPRSLGPTAAYIVVLAIGAWLVSGYVWRFLQSTVVEKSHKE